MRSPRASLFWVLSLAVAVGGMVVAGTRSALGDEVVGVHRLTLVSGPNFVSIPFQGRLLSEGEVQSVSATGLTLAGNPGWSAGQLGPIGGFAQYVVRIVSAGAGSTSVVGDWWPVTANTANAVTVETRGESLSTQVAAGDGVEVRRLISFKDLFGSGGGLKLIPDANYDVLNSEEDLIRFVIGTSFAGEVFYHDGSEGPAGYYFDGELSGTGDGSNLTLLPGQPIVVFRKTGASSLNLLVAGVVPAIPATHYLSPGPNAVGMVYPVPGPVSTSGLLESGWTSDLNFDVLTSEEDVIRAVYGTSFGEEIFHFEGTEGPPGWYVNGELDESYGFEPTRAYMFFVKGPASFRWRQGLPYEP